MLTSLLTTEPREFPKEPRDKKRSRRMMCFLGHAPRHPPHPFTDCKGSFLCAHTHPYTKGLSFGATGLGSRPTSHREVWMELRPRPLCVPRPFLEALLE